MNVFNYFKKIIHKLSLRKQLLLDSPKNLYASLIKEPEFDNIMNNIPKNLSQMEKAYYLYIELGKIINFDYRYDYNLGNCRKIYNSNIDTKYLGLCKSISELYVNMLKDDRVGISADLLKSQSKAQSLLPHIDVILKLDGKNYIANIIPDLYRIKTSKRINHFCFDINSKYRNPKDDSYDNYKYLKDYYEEISYLTRKDIEQLDKKLGYSFFVPKIQNSDERGIYTEDTINLLEKELNDSENFKKYVLGGKTVPREDYLNYKIDYILNNINNIADYNGNIGYDSRLIFFRTLAQKLFSPAEQSLIKVYALTQNGNFLDPISIVKIKSQSNGTDKKCNIYYIYSKEEKKYVQKSQKEMKAFINEYDKGSLHLTNWDFKKATDTLELE